MIIKTRGIVFRHQRYGETSVITDIYTEEKGLQSYIISGVRTKKSKVSSSLLQLMSLVDIVAYFREDRQSLNRVKEIRPAYTFQSIPFDLRKGAVGMFMVEVARKSIQESETNPKLFQFLYDAFYDLDEKKTSISSFHLGFLLELSGFLGFLPSGNPETHGQFFDLKEGSFGTQALHHPHVIGEDLANKFYELLIKGYQNSHEVILAPGQRKRLLHFIVDYYRLHVEGLSEIKSHQILEDVLG